MFVTGVVNNHVRDRQRLTVFLQLLIQAVLALIVAILLYTRVWIIDRTRDAYAIICLLSLCTGSQQITVKYFHIPEVNSTMVTIPIADVLSDPNLLAAFSKNQHRNNRIAFIIVFMVGAIIGGCCLHWSTAELAIVISAAVKFLVTVAMLMMPSETTRKTAADQAEEERQFQATSDFGQVAKTTESSQT